MADVCFLARFNFWSVLIFPAGGSVVQEDWGRREGAWHPYYTVTERLLLQTPEGLCLWKSDSLIGSILKLEVSLIVHQAIYL